MSDVNETTDQTDNESTVIEESEAQEATETKATPPWGSDEEFDPERAWKLISDLRDDLNEAKNKVKAKAVEDVKSNNKTEAAEEAKPDEAATLRLELDRVRASHTLGVPEEIASLVGGVDKTEIEANLTALVEWKNSTTKSVTKRPVETLSSSSGEQPEPKVVSDPHELRSKLFN